MVKPVIPRKTAHAVTSIFKIISSQCKQKPYYTLSSDQSNGFIILEESALPVHKVQKLQNNFMLKKSGDDLMVSTSLQCSGISDVG